MPKLVDTSRRPFKKLVLPSSLPDDEAWVEVYTELLTGDLEQIGDTGELKGLAAITTIKNLIKAWNIQNVENDEVAAITIENIRKLKQVDSMYIIEEVGKIRQASLGTKDETKKKLADYFLAEVVAEFSDNPESVELPKPPQELIELRYREHFHLDYWQSFFTPYHIMIRDMQILGMESSIKNDYRAARTRAATKTKK